MSILGLIDLAGFEDIIKSSADQFRKPSEITNVDLFKIPKLVFHSSLRKNPFFILFQYSALALNLNSLVLCFLRVCSYIRFFSWQKSHYEWEVMVIV